MYASFKNFCSFCIESIDCCKCIFSENPLCLVKTYKEYAQRRPVDKLGDDSNFYLSIILISKPANEIWFKSLNMGINHIAKLAKVMSNEANLPLKHTNHSARRTAIQELRSKAVDPLDVIQLTGHKT